MIKFFKTKDAKETTTMINVDKIAGTVPKVVGVVAALRADVAKAKADAAVAQKKIDELEAILASLVSEGGESAGGVV